MGLRTVGVRAVRAIEPKLVLDSIITNYRLHRARVVIPAAVYQLFIVSSFTY